MFAELSPHEQQRVAQGYMSRLGGKTPADVNKAVQLLLTNNDHAAAAMQLYNTSGVSDPEGRTPNIDMLMANMTKQDGMQDTQEAPMPPKRPAKTGSVSVEQTPTPPTKLVEFTGEDRVQTAGGPGAVERNTVAQAPNAKTTETAAPSSKASIVDKLLTALGVGTGAYAVYKAGNSAAKPVEAKQLPPEADVPNKATEAAPTKFDRVFGEGEIPALPRNKDGKMTYAPPKGTEDTYNERVADNIKEVGTKEEGTQEKVKADNVSVDDEAAPKQKVKAKSTATTVKEKLKPRVKVK